MTNPDEVKDKFYDDLDSVMQHPGQTNLPDKGSLSVSRRSFMPLGSPESLLTRCHLMANPTPASRCSSFLRPLQKKV